MGNDTPISALSDKPKPLFTYFKQNFAQVTNPPIDPIREELVMSLVSIIGPRPNLFDLEGTSRLKRLEVRQPILTDADLEKIRAISDVGDGHFKSRILDTTWPAEYGAAGLKDALETLCVRAESAVREGINIIILSDRRAGPDNVPIPSLLACAAVHHHLIRQGLRTSVGLVVESGEPREVQHFCCLAGYAAARIMRGPWQPSQRFSTRCAAIFPTSIAPTPRSATNSQSGCSPSAAFSGSNLRKRTAASECRSRRSSLRSASCAVSPLAPCRSARSRARRIPRSPSP